ncbi:type II toxin-antitoxin system VapC family toxin [Candidatus Woesearchaeota archaeon]|nr:type II toxin-antitoxin system VapC family toxin [Candidatus Woesearchaeota archaeon]
MKAMLDTSAIVEIDRKNTEVISLIKKLIELDYPLSISTITISEILAGSYLAKDYTEAVQSAKRILAQFIWAELDAAAAEKTGQYIAYLISQGTPIEYADAAIAATAKTTGCDYIITLNKKHFQAISEIRNMAVTPSEMAKLL